MPDPRADVVKKALTDPAFKAELLRNPKAAVEKATGAKLPAGVAVNVFEDTASVVHLVLPQDHSPKPGELSDKTLERVVGGAGKSTLNWQCGDSSAGSPQCVL